MADKCLFCANGFLKGKFKRNVRSSLRDKSKAFNVYDVAVKLYDYKVRGIIFCKVEFEFGFQTTRNKKVT